MQIEFTCIDGISTHDGRIYRESRMIQTLIEYIDVDETISISVPFKKGDISLFNQYLENKTPAHGGLLSVNETVAITILADYFDVRTDLLVKVVATRISAGCQETMHRLCMTDRPTIDEARIINAQNQYIRFLNSQDPTYSAKLDGPDDRPDGSRRN